MIYTVHVNPWGEPKEAICQCRGYTFRGACAHQQLAHDQVCGWHEAHGEKQYEDDAKQMICPKCGGPTIWTMVVV